MSHHRLPDLNPIRRPGFAPIRAEHRYAFKTGKEGAGGCIILALLIALIAAAVWYGGRQGGTTGGSYAITVVPTEARAVVPPFESYPAWPTRPPTSLPNATLVAADLNELGQAAIEWAWHEMLIDDGTAVVLETNEIYPEDAELLGVPPGHIERGAVPDIQILIEGTYLGERIYVLVELDHAYGIYGHHQSGNVDRLRELMP